MTTDKRATILFDDLFVLTDEIPSVRIQVIRDALHAATSELQNELKMERIKHRTSLEDMTESRDSWKEMAQNLGISLAILQDAAEKIVSDNAPSDPDMLKESKRDWDVRVLKEALKLARGVGTTAQQTNASED